MSKQWRKLMDKQKPDIEDVRLLFKALEKNADFHGSQWLWMFLVVKVWLEALEQQEAKAS